MIFAYSLPIFTVSLWTNSSGATKEEKCPRNNINKDRRSGLFRYPFTCVTITQIINPARMIPPRISRIFRAFFRPWAHILCIRTSDTPRFPFPRRIFGSAWFRDCPKDFYFLSAYSFPSRFLFFVFIVTQFCRRRNKIRPHGGFFHAKILFGRYTPSLKT